MRWLRREQRILSDIRFLPQLKVRAEECLGNRGGHSFSSMVLVQGQPEYCVYCLTYSVGGTVVFDPMTAKAPPESS